MPFGGAVVLFAVFAALSAAGAYALAAHFRSRRLGVLLALLTLIFFAALFAALVWLVGQADLTAP
jgi:hypothetical protein